jgi:hypothetical protein
VRPIRVLLSLAATSLLPACGALSLGDVSCTDEFIASTRTTVVNARGEPQRDARVTFSVDGGPEQDAWCVGGSQASGGLGCDAWETPDQKGTFVLRATSADGQRRVEQQLNVPGDECHAEETVPVQFVLPD